MKIKKGLLQVHQQQKEDQENVSLLLNDAECMVKKDMEKAEVYNEVHHGLHCYEWPSVFPASQGLWVSLELGRFTVSINWTHINLWVLVRSTHKH